jgi:hypothetical protein
MVLIWAPDQFITTVTLSHDTTGHVIFRRALGLTTKTHVADEINKFPL